MKGRNLFDLVPVRKVEHEIDPATSRVTLLVPRFTSKLARKLLGGLNKNPIVSMRLDDIGSFLWLRMDGAKNLLRLADELRAQFGERVDPVAERVALFARSLSRDGFIDLSELRSFGDGSASPRE